MVKGATVNVKKQQKQKVYIGVETVLNLIKFAIVIIAFPFSLGLGLTDTVTNFENGIECSESNMKYFCSRGFKILILRIWRVG